MLFYWAVNILYTQLCSVINNKVCNIIGMNVRLLLQPHMHMHIDVQIAHTKNTNVLIIVFYNHYKILYIFLDKINYKHRNFSIKCSPTFFNHQSFFFSQKSWNYKKKYCKIECEGKHCRETDKKKLWIFVVCILYFLSKLRVFKLFCKIVSKWVVKNISYLIIFENERNKIQQWIKIVGNLSKHQ